MSSATTAEHSMFLKERHIKYWLRCLKTYLPHQYTSNDSNRMTLAFFTVSALDLLGVLEAKTTAEERQGYIDWIYQCQVSSGGFRGFTGTNFGESRRTLENECWDPANIPATFFALLTLIILGDDFVRVRRKECLEWLPMLQRDDGSFGEGLGEGGMIEGGNDLRFCCCAAGIRHILHGFDLKETGSVKDIDVESLIGYIEACQTYDGGFAEAPFREEAHAGLTYCAIGALSFLDQIPLTSHPATVKGGRNGVPVEDLIRWLVARQTNLLEEDDEEELDDDGDQDVPQADPDDKSHTRLSQTTNSMSLDSSPKTQPYDVLDIRLEDWQWAGFNGRCNKVADTCYCYWNSGSLAILGKLDLIDSTANRRYLLEKTQPIVGGFSKAPGDPPDIMHAFLGLATLAAMGDSNIATIDPALCISHRSRLRLQSLRLGNQK